MRLVSWWLSWYCVRASLEPHLCKLSTRSLEVADHAKLDSPTPDPPLPDLCRPRRVTDETRIYTV